MAKAKPIRCTKNLIAMQKAATTQCYHSALFVAQAILVKKHPEIAKFDRESLQYWLRDNGHKEMVDVIYRKEICKLPTRTLEAIMACYTRGYFSRAGITIASIKEELASRILLNDSNEKQ